MARPRSDVPERIVHAARGRFLVDGVDGASLRRIARDAGTNIGMIYYYFPSKEDLFVAVIEEIYGTLIAELSEQVAAGDDAEDGVRRLYARFGRMSEDELTVVRLVIREMLVSSARRRRVLELFSHGHIPLLLAAVREGVQGGELAPDLSPGVMVLSLLSLGMFPQLIRRLVGDRLPGIALPDPDGLAEELAHVLLRGIGAQP